MKAGDVITKAELIENEYGEYYLKIKVNNSNLVDENLNIHWKQHLWGNLNVEWLDYAYVKEVLYDRNNNYMRLVFIPNHKLNSKIPKTIGEFTWDLKDLNTDDCIIISLDDE